MIVLKNFKTLDLTIPNAIKQKSVKLGKICIFIYNNIKKRLAVQQFKNLIRVLYYIFKVFNLKKRTNFFQCAN